jgi:hypothetical protein
MSNQRNLFRIIRAVGLLAFLGLIITIEYRFIYGGRADGSGWLMQQLVAIVTTLLLPHFWVLLALILIGHIGKWRIDRRLKKETAQEQTA